MTRHLTSAGEPATAGPGGPDGLWAQVPGGLRSLRLSPDTVPEEYRSAFRHYGDGTRNSRGRTPVDLSVLPDGLRKEITWCMFRIADLGGVIGMSHGATVVRMLGAAVAADAGPAASSQVSLLDAGVQEWCQRIRAVFCRDSGRFPSPATMRCVEWELHRYSRVLEAAYDTRAWWQREVWRPAEDPRIPQRDHEPRGRESIGFTRFTAPWLRAGLQWFGKSVLETGQMTWSTLLQRVGAMAEFDAFLAGRGTFPPHLADDPAAVRALMRDYLAHVSTRRVARGKRAGELISASQRKILVICVEQFYAFMSDHAEEAAAALGEPGWLRLGPHHAMLVRRGERPRRRSPGEPHRIIDDAIMTKIMGQAGMLGAPAADGGFGDEQAMRLLMLQARLGRRINELCMLDHEPLTMLGRPSDDHDPGAFVARLRYQQTKIDGAPDTILVDAEIVAIIQAQQDWAARHFAAAGRPGRTPRYLFLGSMMNRNGDRPYNSGQFRHLLTELAARSGIRDADGRVIDLQRTHTFRHTAATSLLNAGVPLHVVQRWLGHLTPAMTMTYAQTLAETAEAEFLRYRKLTSDGRETTLNPEDLYDMLQLDQRTDRILPHGYCTLPPRQSCDRGNACLTCGKFVTDASFLPELRQQHQRTLQLIEIRQQAFTARTGTPMSDDNIWLQGRRRETAALEAITAALEAEPGHHARRDGTSAAGASGTTNPGAAGPRAVRGAGVTARTGQAAARATGKKGTNQT
jgi:Phage integrase family